MKTGRTSSAQARDAQRFSFRLLATLIIACSLVACRQVSGPAPSSSGSPGAGPAPNSSGSPGAGSETSSPGEALPAQLVDTWVSNSSLYTFKSDGSFEYTGVLQTDMSGCTKSILVYKTGTATAKGRTLTLNTTAGAREYKDSCSRSNDYREALTSQVEQFPWRIAVDESGAERLYLTLPKGEISWWRKR